MYSLLKLVARLRRDRTGATAIEYALILALIALAIITSVTSLGTNVAGMWGGVATNTLGAMGH